MGTVSRVRLLRAPLPALLALLLVACGDEPEAPPSTEIQWSHCRIEGVKAAGGVAALGDELFLCAGAGDRAIYVLPIGRLAPGARITARKLQVDVDEKATLTGRELLARRGYTLGNLWQADVDFQGIAVQQPDLLFVADRQFRVVYWGKLVREIGGEFGRWQVRHAFEVPGAKRANVQLADYSDTGPGVSGLFGVSGSSRTEDLYLVERARPGSEDVRSQFRVLTLDRYGSLAGGGDLGFFTVDVGGGAVPDVEGVAYDRANERFLCVRGAGRGSIAAFRDPGSLRTGKLARGVPGPELEGVGRWCGLTVGADGTWYLVSDGDPAVVAWRKP